MWDPQEAGAAAIYLRLDEKELLTIRSQDFDGRKKILKFCLIYF